MTLCDVQDLRDRNDELSLEVELLKNQKGSDRSCRREQEGDAPSWAEHQQAAECDSGGKARLISQSEGSRDKGTNGFTWWVWKKDFCQVDVLNHRKSNTRPCDVTKGIMPEAAHRHLNITFLKLLHRDGF